MNKTFFKRFVLLCTVFILAFSVCAAYAEEEYTYESEFARLPEEVQALENIRLIDDHDEAVVMGSCGDNQNKNHLYGSSYFSGESDAMLSLDFEGTVIGVLVEKGGFDIYIDDEYVDSVGGPAKSGCISQLIYYNDQLTNDYHNITVITNKDLSMELTPEPYSVFRGFIVQDVVEPIPTEVPTEVPTEAPATEVVATPTAAPTAQPTKAPATSAPEADEAEGSSNTLLIIIIVLATLVIVASAVLIIIKSKKK